MATSSVHHADPGRTGPDITACDLEPIHIPGSIQPHGLLLVANADDRRLVAAAGDVERRLSPDWLGALIDDVIGIDVAAALDGAAGDAQGSIVLDRVKGTEEMFDAVLHRTDGRLLVEFTVTEQMPTAEMVLATLDGAGTLFERAVDLRELCDRAVAAFRTITGYDRVMLYRFLDDDAGVVVAEDRDPKLGTFLNHHFPASDIPRQARALYVRNRVRVIPDITYVPAPLRAADPGLAAVDMSDVTVRSVSPIHLQYLHNMGVGASASVSIVKDGLLWGLIACHHNGPRQLSHIVQMSCRTLAGALSRQIKAREDAERYRERIRLRAAEDALLADIGSDVPLETFLVSHVATLAAMLDADGFALRVGRDYTLFGQLPHEADVREVARWAVNQAAVQPFASHHLEAMFDDAADFRDRASGLLAVTLSTEEPIQLLWFRAEQIEVVEWAGNPHKAVKVAPGEMLTPRTSFAAWSEQVRGRARRWTLGEVEAATRLKRLLLEARQTRRLRELNRELTAAISEKDGLIQQKDFLLKEVNHRVQNSLQLVSAFLGLQARAGGDAVLTGHLAEAQRRLQAVALVHRRLYSDDQIQAIDLSRYLDDLCGEMRSSMGPEWGEHITLDLSPILISTDRAVNVGLILTELVINAQKYAYAGEPGPISIALEQHRNRFRLIVADHGPGKSKMREGFGTRMLNAMVDRLSGTIEDMGNSPGLRVIVTAPIGEG